MTATAILTLTARPELTHARHAVLRFELAPAHQRRSWYTATVTATLASQIRALAAERGYDKLDADAQRALRREIADELGTRSTTVLNTLRRTGSWGRPRVHEERCPTCERAVLDNATREAIARNTAKSKRSKR